MKSILCRACMLDSQQNQVEGEIPLGPFLQKSGHQEDCERVSTGTKYALEQFLLKTSQTLYGGK